MKVLQFVFSFKGRLGRQAWWLANILIFTCFLISGAMLESVETEDYGIILMFASLWLFFPVSVKRWHDRNKSGFWMLVYLIPWVGALWAFIELGFLPGTKGPNRFNPEGRRTQDKRPEESPDEPSQDEFVDHYGDFVAMLAKMAKSDGVITQAEIQTVDQLFSNIFEQPEEKEKAISIFRKSKDSIITFEEHARAVALRHSQDQPFLSALVEALFYLSISDGGMSAEEELLLNTAESILGVRSTGYSNYQDNSQSGGASEEVKDYTYYTKVLGLSRDASKEEIRTRYKELVRQYHPDKVSHLGERLKEVAHEEIQRINEAYEYLKKACEA